MVLTVDIPELQCNLANWFRREGRSLPWRDAVSPYLVAVSEIMLQQTRVPAVIPYFLRWAEKFPSVQDLAGASEEEVLALWQGLGYYSRARNLHRFAREVCRRFGGQVPSGEGDLLALPGVGDYTAAAVRAFAFDLPAPVIDGNIARVLARLFDCHLPVDSAAGKKFLSDAAMKLQEGEISSRLWNSALMDLGATVCTTGEPACGRCPAREFCKTKHPSTLPKKKAKAEITSVSEARGLCFSNGKIWLEKSAGPRWKGLWILPEIEEPPGSEPVVCLEYPITRYKVTMRVFSSLPAPSSEAHDAESFQNLPMPSPHRRAIALWASSATQK